MSDTEESFVRLSVNPLCGLITDAGSGAWFPPVCVATRSQLVGGVQNRTRTPIVGALRVSTAPERRIFRLALLGMDARNGRSEHP